MDVNSDPKHQALNWKYKLRSVIQQSQDAMDELKTNLQMYNTHKDKVSPTYHNQMEKIKRNMNLIIASSQSAFVCSYSFLFLKLVLFNHYRRYSPAIKFTLFCFYGLTLEPLTLASCNNQNLYININIY